MSRSDDRISIAQAAIGSDEQVRAAGILGLQDNHKAVLAGLDKSGS